MNVKRICDWELEDHLGLDETPTVVLFIKAGEPSHRTARREFRQIAISRPDARFYEVDLLENPSLAAKFSIRTLPLTLVFAGGVEVARHAGSFQVGTVEGILDHPPEEDGENGG